MKNVSRDSTYIVHVYLHFAGFQIIELEHVVSCKDPRFWQHSGEILVSAIVVQCQNDVSEQKMIHNVSDSAIVLQVVSIGIVSRPV